MSLSSDTEIVTRHVMIMMHELCLDMIYHIENSGGVVNYTQQHFEELLSHLKPTIGMYATAVSNQVSKILHYRLGCLTPVERATFECLARNCMVWVQSAMPQCHLRGWMKYCMLQLALFHNLSLSSPSSSAQVIN